MFFKSYNFEEVFFMDAPKMSVKCGVNSCDYWQSNMCHAHMLEVNPMRDAADTYSSEDTRCETFIPRT